MAEATHKCPIRGCTRRVPSHALLCAVHLPMVAPATMRDLQRAYKVGQSDMTASNEWRSAKERAIKEVHAKLDAQKEEPTLPLDEGKES